MTDETKPITCMLENEINQGGTPGKQINCMKEK